MSGIRMVPLVAVPSVFQGQVIAARLGADGILAQLRGGVDGPYPVGGTVVWVEEEQLAVATELVSDADRGAARRAGRIPSRRQLRCWLVVAAVVLMAAASTTGRLLL